VFRGSKKVEKHYINEFKRSFAKYTHKRKANMPFKVTDKTIDRRRG